MKKYYYRLRVLILLCCVFYFDLVVTDYKIARQYRADYETMKIGYEANRWAQGGKGAVIKKPDDTDYRTCILNYKWKYPYLGYPVLSLKDSYVTCEKGWRKIFGAWEYHYSTDIVCLSDLRVVSMVGGTIESIGYSGYYGNYVIVKSIVNYNDKLYNVVIRYSHLSIVYVKRGQSVLQGFELGVQGNSGRVLKYPGMPWTGVHLDITVIINGEHVNIFKTAIIGRKCEP